MEDMERYGDYTEYEDDIPKNKKSPVLRALKWFVILICISVIGIFTFRIIAFNYYPDTMEDIYFTDALAEHYNKNGGNIGAKTQELRFPYDNADFANFFCDNMIVIEEIGEIQFSIRYNDSAFEDISTKLKIKALDPENENVFTYVLRDNYGNAYTPTAIIKDEFLMYNYCKLVFDGIPFKSEDGKKPEWLRVEVFVEGQKQEDAQFMVPVYENHKDFSIFEEYELSGKEKP